MEQRPEGRWKMKRRLQTRQPAENVEYKVPKDQRFLRTAILCI